MFESLCFLSLMYNILFFFSSFNLYVLLVNARHFTWLFTQSIYVYVSMFFRRLFFSIVPSRYYQKRYIILHFRLIKFHMNQKNQFLTLQNCNFFLRLYFFVIFFFFLYFVSVATAIIISNKTCASINADGGETTTTCYVITHTSWIPIWISEQPNKNQQKEMNDERNQMGKTETDTPKKQQHQQQHEKKRRRNERKKQHIQHTNRTNQPTN